MELPDSHIYLVAERAEARLDAFAPLFDLIWRPKRLLLIAGVEDGVLLQRLADYLNAREVNTVALLLNLSQPRESLERLRAVVTRWQRGPFALNISGGNGLLLWAALEICRERGGLSFHRQGSQLQLLSAPGGSAPIQPSWRLYDLLTLFGISGEGGAIEGWPQPLHRAFALRLLGEIDQVASALELLGTWARAADIERGSVPLRGGLLQDGVQGVIERFEAARLLTLDGGKLFFPNVSVRVFCADRWLTLCLYEALYAQLQRAARSSEFAFEVILTPSAEEVESISAELLCASDERVFVFKRSMGDEAAFETLEQLYALHAWIPNLTPILFMLSTPSEHLTLRAAELSVSICGPAALRQLPSWFAEQLGIGVESTRSARAPRAPGAIEAPTS
ncbi:MAG: hypothetical protein VYD19_04550 [Myxococcota bacterium]|nr:hypothetical protein [Myxococcota bacterium]